MAFQEKNQDGVSNGATAATVVSAPAVGARRIVRTLVVSNVDTVDGNLTVRVNRGGTFRRIEPSFPMTPNQTWWLPHPIYLDGTDESLELLLGGAVTTNEWEYHASFAEVT